MKAIVVKLPARYVLLMGEGAGQQVEFVRSDFQGAEVAKHYGVTEVIQGDIACLSFTYTAASEPPSQDGSSPKGSVPTSIRGGSTRS